MATTVKYQEPSTKLINIDPDEFIIKDELNDYTSDTPVTKIKLIPKIKSAKN